VSVRAFPADFVGFFVKNSCRTAHLAAPPPGSAAMPSHIVRLRIFA